MRSTIEYTVLNPKNNKQESNLTEISVSREMFFSQRPEISLRILDCFPGGRLKLQQMVFEKTNNYSMLSDVSFLIKNFVKTKLVSEEQLIHWRNNLTQLPNAENDPEISNIIGTLTLCTKEINHIAYVADGNRRWAKSLGLSADKSHEQSFVTTIPHVAEEIFQYGIHTFSIWLFQPDNLDRNKEEVIGSIFKYLINSLKVYLDMAKKLNVRIFHIGNKKCSHPDPDIQNEFYCLMDLINIAEKETQLFSKHHLIMGANYTRLDDYFRAFKKINSQKINLDELQPDDINKFTDVGNQLYPYPDLFIRTAMPYAGRVGDFLLDVSKTCVYFTPILAPELSIKDIIAGATIFANPLVRYKSNTKAADEDYPVQKARL